MNLDRLQCKNAEESEIGMLRNGGLVRVKGGGQRNAFVNIDGGAWQVGFGPLSELMASEWNRRYTFWEWRDGWGVALGAMRWMIAGS